MINDVDKGEPGGADGADQAKGSRNEDEELKWDQSIFFSSDIVLEHKLWGWNCNLYFGKIGISLCRF